MKNVIFALTLTSLISGCAQNQMPGLQSQSTTKSFLNCGFSVQFSGQPEEFKGDIPTAISDGLGGKPERPIWRYASLLKGVQKYEVAMCVCLAEPALSIKKTEFGRTGFGSTHVEGIGFISESNMTEIDGGVRDVSRIIIGDESSCLLFQSAGASGAPDFVREVTAPFRNSLAPLPKQRQDPVAKTTNASASERLKQLDTLLKEKLISEDEFKKRRAIIVDNL